MGITMIALAGILLLGAGIAILVVNLGRTKSSTATIEQIGTYGYVAENTGGSEVDAARRPLDSLAGRLGDITDEFRHEVAETKWLPLEDAPRLLAYGGEREMAAKALQLIDERAV